MKTLLKGTLLALALIVALPEQAQSQSVWDRARDIMDDRRERASDSDRQTQAERERQVERERQARAERDRAESDRRAREEAVRREQSRTGSAQRGSSGDYGSAGTQGRRAQNGPPFCRNGSGHPVHGMAWCYDKGFGGASWHRGSLGDVIFDRGHERNASRSVTGRALDQIFGRETTRRAQEYARSEGLRGAVSGRWTDANTFELAMDGTPFARLTDRNRNGRVDATMLARFR
jgi:hypothetical protein